MCQFIKEQGSFCKRLIQKVESKSYKYYLTSLDREVTATSLKLKEMVVIPILRGNLNLS